MSSALDIASCRGDCGSGATNKHFPLCLCRCVDGFQANTGAKSNRGPVIRTGDRELIGKGDVLEVGGPKE
jgi:hypothetical protein